MSEDQDLLARIGQLAGHINLHKTQAPQPAIRGYPKPTLHTASHKISSASRSTSWKSGRHAPYPRSHLGAAKPSPHRSRSLVLHKTTSPSPAYNEKRGTAVVHNDEIDTKRGLVDPATSWIARRDRHMQLINSSVFDKETQLRSKAMDETRRQKALQRDQREKQKIEKHLRALSGSRYQGSSTQFSGASSTAHQIVINGLSFQVMDGGSKLLRIRNAGDPLRSTPKKANVGGVTFFRSRNGNLYRSGIVKANRATGKYRKILEPCKRFTTSGNCSKGPLCPYLHDPATVAICKDFLQTGTCPAGDSCDLSHDPSPERVPACLHFLRGKCSNPSCRYAHVRVNPSAPVCRAFAILGYCGKGASCTERHVHECPDYANNGACGNKSCHLPHVDRAGQIRKHAAKSTDIPNSGDAESGDDNNSDLVSEEEDLDEIDSDDVDSDGFEDDPIQISYDTASENLSQQHDFVHF